jgi:uncharacterized membrane protein YbhN (UPF0104 family)
MVQDNELSTPKEKIKRLNLLWLGKLTVTLLILGYIYRTFQNEQRGVQDVGNVLFGLFSFEHAYTLSLVLALVPVNWALETLKWQTLAEKVTPLSFREAFQSTLTGLAVGVAVPAQLGDTIGRIASLRSDRRLEAIGAALVSNGIQFYISVLGGTAGWLLVQERLNLPLMTKLSLNTLLFSILMLGPIAFLFRKSLTDWHPRKAFFSKIQSYLRIAGSYSPRELGISLAYAALRYLVFLAQFVLILTLFNFQVSVPDLSACVSLIFLAKTLIPAINVLGDLGLREFTALLVFASYNLPAEKIIAATFLVWIVNVLGPILIGVFLIWKYKWKQFRL